MIADIDKLCSLFSVSCNYLMRIAICIHTKNIIMEADMMETVKIEHKRKDSTQIEREIETNRVGTMVFFNLRYSFIPFDCLYGL